MSKDQNTFMQRAIALADQGMQEGTGGPFGAVIVKNGEIIAEASNQVTSTNDPTAHAEIAAIRLACDKLGSFQLDDCILYTSCEPCPMCLGAIYWSRFKQVFYAATQEDAAAIGFDDQFIYDELEKPMKNRKIPFEQTERDQAVDIFKKWDAKSDRVDY
ncbi:MAG TPA: nucleoside deaminase [Leeuwenhoekiella sp.]|nr:nucleoside deaminase [Leeuwenhoekiella sp.]